MAMLNNQRVYMLYQDPPMTYSIYNYIYISLLDVHVSWYQDHPWKTQGSGNHSEPGVLFVAFRPVCSWRGLPNNGGGFPGISTKIFPICHCQARLCDCIDDWCDWCHLVATARNSATARQCLTWRSLPQAVSIACVACPCRKEQYPAADLGCALRGHMLQSGNWPYSCLIGHWLSHKLKMDIPGIVTGCRMLYTGCWFQGMYIYICIYTSYIIYTCHIIISYIVIYL